MRHQDSRIYQRALELTDLSKAAIEQMPVGFGFLNDQLRRATASVVLNFAEGCGKRTRRDRQCRFDTARGSANEVGAVFDVAMRFGAINTELGELGCEVADHVAAMLARFH